MNFLDKFKENELSIITYIQDSLNATPMSLNHREYRTLMDHPLRASLLSNMPDLFRESKTDAWDIEFCGYRVSIKKQNKIFSRKSLRGPGYTNSYPIQMGNTLRTNSSNNTPNYKWDYLIAYQPCNGNEKFGLGIMSVDKATKLSYPTKKKKGESDSQWLMKADNSDWDYVILNHYFPLKSPKTSKEIDDFEQYKDKEFRRLMKEVWQHMSKISKEEFGISYRYEFNME